MNHDMYKIAYMMGFGSSPMAWSPGPLLQQAWGPTSNKGVRTIGHTIGLKFKAQMGLGTPCHTVVISFYLDPQLTLLFYILLT